MLMGEAVIRALRSLSGRAARQIPVMVAHDRRNVPRAQFGAAFIDLAVVASHVTKTADITDPHRVEPSKHRIQSRRIAMNIRNQTDHE